MGKDQFAVVRARTSPGVARLASGLASASVATRPFPIPDALSVLAAAASVRLEDPRDERERVMALKVAIVAGRAAARAFDTWLSHSLAEYRGSRTARDLKVTTAKLRLELDQFDAVLRDTSDRLTALIPGLVGGSSDGPVVLDTARDVFASAASGSIMQKGGSR